MKAILALLLLFPAVATAQELESLAGVRLNFDRVGARALAMGSTVMAAKDAGAAAENPAAIADSTRSFSIETRRRTMEGRYAGDPTLNVIGIESSTDGIRSASLTMPIAGATWSFFYDEPLDVRHSTAAAFSRQFQSQAAFFVCGGRLSASPCDQPMVVFNQPATYPLDIDLRLQRYGAAAAWSRGPLAFGASVRREQLRQQAAFVDAGILSSGYAGIAETTEDTSYTWGAGATWSFGPRARIGAAYSSGASFAGARSFPFDTSDRIEFRTPPSFGAGISFDPIPQLTLTADAVRVRYSAMMHERRNFIANTAELGYPDVTELHAGAEYRAGSYALRAGWWRDPAHALTTLNGLTPLPPMHYVHALQDSSENHLTAGIGYGEKTRFDASIDRSTRSTRVAFGVSSTF